MHDIWSHKPHPLQAVSLITFIPPKPWDWITFSALGRTEPDSPNDSLIHKFYCHICLSVYPCPLSLTVSRLPSREVIFPVPLSQLSSNCRANYLCTIVISGLHRLPGPAISWATLVILFEFRLHSVYCVLSHWTQLFCIGTHKPEMLKNTASAYAVVPCPAWGPWEQSYTGNLISPVSKSDFGCSLQIT